MRKEEKKLLNSINPVSIEGTKIILEQMMRCVCKIKIKGTLGTGFFCKIPIENDTQINCLLTNYHIIDKDYFQKNKEINLLLNDEKDVIIIDLNKKREIYLSKEYDVALLEIIESDKIENFLELDDNLFKKETKVFFEEISIYIIQYQNVSNVTVSYGLIRNFDNNDDIIHTCNTNYGSSGSPILNLSNNKLIGIHKQASSLFNYNIGSLLKKPLSEFKEKIKEQKHQQNINNYIFNRENIANFLPMGGMNMMGRIETMRGMSMMGGINYEISNIIGNSMGGMNQINNAPNSSEINSKNNLNINGKVINIIFQNFGSKKLCININDHSTIQELINGYLIKSGKAEAETLFLYNNKRINSYNTESISEFGLRNSTTISVLDIGMLVAAFCASNITN